jgi:AcrR family transcriptional regulator
MSTRQPRSAREKLLDAADALFVERGYHGVGLDAVARRARVTRQTVYNIFGSKAGLLAALTAHVEDRAGLPGRIADVMSQTDGLSMLRAMLDAGVSVEPLVLPYSRVVHAARLDDPTAAELWANRMGSRLMGMTMVMNRLHAEGLLREGLSPASAAEIAWALMSPHQYELLVVDRGWGVERYREHLEQLIGCAVLKEAPSSRGRAVRSRTKGPRA